MATLFKCEACGKRAPRLSMRDRDGKWVCFDCLPRAEVRACPGLAERVAVLRERRDRRRVRRPAARKGGAS